MWEKQKCTRKHTDEEQDGDRKKNEWMWCRAYIQRIVYDGTGSSRRGSEEEKDRGCAARENSSRGIEEDNTNNNIEE